MVALMGVLLLTGGLAKGMNPGGVSMRPLISMLLAFALGACALGATEQAHPTDGRLHHPAGVCVLGTRVHVVSTNHDRRYRTGAVVTYSKADLLAGAAVLPERVWNHETSDWPEGFGAVLNLASCQAAQGEQVGTMVVLDRVARAVVRLQADADGVLSCLEPGCPPQPLGGEDADGLMAGIRDPGAAVAAGEHLLFSSRVDEQATQLTLDGALTRSGSGLATRPVVHGP